MPLPATDAAVLAVILAAVLLRPGRSVLLGQGRAGGAVDAPPSVSVVVPARDEATTLPALLQSLRRSEAQPLEVLVVDDDSSDATAAVAVAHGAGVVPAGPLPPGWAGKPWACATGARRARGDVLVFLDADVRLAPEALGTVVAQLARHGGLLSVQPHHVTEHWYEQLSACFNLVAVLGSGMFAVAPPRRRPAAYGPCLATDAATYRRCGGHGAVRDAVVEDVALAQSYRRHGEAVTCRLGGRLVAFRMYPGGLGHLVEGWTKNVAAGAAGGARWAALATAVWVVCLVVVATGVAWSPWWLLGYLVVVVHLVWLLGRVGRFRLLTAVLFPVPLAFFVAVFARSALALLRGRAVRWKGRSVATRPDRGR